MDSYLLLFIFIFVLFIIIKNYINISSSIKKCNNITTDYCGFDVANFIVEKNNIDNPYILKKNGINTNTYMFSRNVIKLNNDIFDNYNLSSCIISSIIASYSESNNKLFRFTIALLPTIKLLILTVYIVFLVSIFARQNNLVVFSILAIFVIVIYLLITSLCFNSINSKALLNLRKMKIVNKENVDYINDFLEAYKHINVILFITLIIDLFNLK